ncbi:MAG TPA: hypothetical protein VJV79_13380 [Polyangiaceae bacterium]|nr:hypothetical protein [Polyangiaceae bacterium]
MKKTRFQRTKILLLGATVLALGCGEGAKSVAEGGGAGAAPTSSAGGGSGGSIASDGGSSAGAPTGAGAGSSGGSGSGGARSGEVIAVNECMITTPTHWSAGVYVVNCKLELASTLTIDPGAIVKFGLGFYLSVQPGAKLAAIGSDSLPIIFTSLKDDAHGGDTNGDGVSTGAANDWGCQGSCGDLNIQGDGSVLEHVHALYGSNGVYIQAASTQISKSTFAHHESYGLVLDGRFPVGTTLLTGNAFFDNHGYPLRLGKTVFLDASNVFHDPANPELKNGKQCIEVDTDLDQLAVLGVTELGFLFSGHRIGSELLTPPGVIFKARDAAIYLDAGGSLYNGPNAIFTSYKDDSLGGDCTGDGASAPAVGDWEGLWIDDGTKADYAAPVDYIRYASKSGSGILH